MTDNGSTHGFGIVLGEPARLEAALLARIAAVRARDPLAPIDVLVGGVLLRPYLQRLIAESTPGLANVRMTTHVVPPRLPHASVRVSWRASDSVLSAAALSGS